MFIHSNRHNNNLGKLAYPVPDPEHTKPGVGRRDSIFTKPFPCAFAPFVEQGGHAGEWIADCDKFYAPLAGPEPRHHEPRDPPAVSYSYPQAQGYRI